MRPRPLPDFQALREAFDYNKESGKLSRKTGGPGERISRNGYLRITIGGKGYLVHRIIWKLQTGDDGNFYIDHRNGDKLDNRWENLRKATNAQNMCNKGRQKNNVSGYKGVFYEKSRACFRAYIGYNGKRLPLGRFKTAVEAHQIYCAAAIRLHKQFANFGESPT